MLKKKNLEMIHERTIFPPFPFSLSMAKVEVTEDFLLTAVAAAEKEVGCEVTTLPAPAAGAAAAVTDVLAALRPLKVTSSGLKRAPAR